MHHWLLVSCLVLAGAGGACAGEVRLLADFEPGAPALVTGGRIEKQAALSCEGALRIEAESVVMDRPMDWSGSDFLHIDTFNPKTEVEVGFCS